MLGTTTTCNSSSRELPSCPYTDTHTNTHVLKKTNKKKFKEKLTFKSRISDTLF